MNHHRFTKLDGSELYSIISQITKLDIHHSIQGNRYEKHYQSNYFSLHHTSELEF